VKRWTRSYRATTMGGCQMQDVLGGQGWVFLCGAPVLDIGKWGCESSGS
jgi:hypothetical protein